MMSTLIGDRAELTNLSFTRYEKKIVHQLYSFTFIKIK